MNNKITLDYDVNSGFKKQLKIKYAILPTLPNNK